MRRFVFLLSLTASLPVSAASSDLCGQMVMPTAGVAELSSGFGFRWGALHSGLDFRGPTGTPIHSVAAGEIIHAGSYGAYGNTVEILHEGGIVTRYAHMSRIAPNITPGTMVTAQQEIGALGSTGRSTGPHLHLEVRINGRPVDPAPWLALSSAACNVTPEALTEEARTNGRSPRADSVTTARLMPRGLPAADSTTRQSRQQQALATQNSRVNIEAGALDEHIPTETELSADVAATQRRMTAARSAVRPPTLTAENAAPPARRGALRQP